VRDHLVYRQALLHSGALCRFKQLSRAFYIRLEFGLPAVTIAKDHESVSFAPIGRIRDRYVGVGDFRMGISGGQ
jgi:hypothetical protein